MGERHRFRLQFTVVVSVSVQCECGFDCFHTKHPLHAIELFCAPHSHDSHTNLLYISMSMVVPYQGGVSIVHRFVLHLNIDQPLIV